MKINQTSAEAIVEFLLFEPVTVRRPGMADIVGDRVQWRTWVGSADYAVPNCDHTGVTLFGDKCNVDLGTRYDDGWEDLLPEWCPRPQEGWDAHVRAFRDSLVEDGTVQS